MTEDARPRTDEGPNWAACEGILERVKHSCFGMHLLYRTEFLRLRGRMSYYDVPIIVFSSINSVLIAGGKDFIPADILQIVTCLLAVITGIIQALKNFFKIDENRENCLSTFKDLMKLFCEISFILDQPRHTRGVEPRKFAQDKGNEYQTIMSKALILKDEKVRRNPIYEDTLPYHAGHSGLSQLFRRSRATNGTNTKKPRKLDDTVYGTTDVETGSESSDEITPAS